MACALLTAFRPLLRDGWRTTELAAGEGGGDEVIPDDGGGPQSGSDPVAPVRNGQAVGAGGGKLSGMGGEWEEV